MSGLHGSLTHAEGRRIRVRGLVQGVGFRPHVWRLANDAGLAGHVLNDGDGVEVDAWGSGEALDRFIEAIESRAPPLARVDSVRWQALTGPVPEGGFSIAESAEGAVSTGIVPDAATCSQCLADIADPDNRRYRYAFTNCTHCGPRLSIVQSIPYDRAKTSMSVFQMCEACAAEYDDPADRRFHAQPNACSACGPHLWLEDGDGRVARQDPISEAAQRIRDGAIVAIKGIGGFHLACNATDETAVQELRRRKRRHAKPLALMARDIAMIRRFCEVGADEKALLDSPTAPIVLLARQHGGLAPGIAPGQDSVGFMLPYSPLHRLLMDDLDDPIVLTSGNLSDEPQATDNADARHRLVDIADLWLMHDREIVNRLDDSVMRVDVTGPQILRRARGLAPEPITLASAFGDAPPVLAMGGELKSAFCLLKDGQAILSQHMGDLEEAATLADYRKTIALYRDIFRFEPAVVAVDRHPDYFSMRLGEAIAAETGARLVPVQHHHAHLASCLAEHGLAPGDGAAVGIVLDGLGLGTDGTVWGGEILLGGYEGFTRKAHFMPVPLPGGDRAIREPWRNLVAHLFTAFGPHWLDRAAGTELGRLLAEKPLKVIDRMIEGGVNAPPSSSAGRLFDAVAAALGICSDLQHYEGQAAMEMEALATPYIDQAGAYPVDISDTAGVLVLSWRLQWDTLLTDLKNEEDRGLIAARFHCGLAQALAAVADRVASENGIGRIALSGGVMQNRLLLRLLHGRLTDSGYTVLVQTRAPANDGGLALGQATIAALSAP